jgi:hypothetical protein
MVVLVVLVLLALLALVTDPLYWTPCVNRFYSHENSLPISYETIIVYLSINKYRGRY